MTVVRGAQHRRGQPARLVGINWGALVARQLVVRAMLGARVRVQRRGRYVGDEVLVEAASLAGVRGYRSGRCGGAARDLGADKAPKGRPAAGSGEIPHAVSCGEA
jgi:hypothetical protein